MSKNIVSEAVEKMTYEGRHAEGVVERDGEEIEIRLNAYVDQTTDYGDSYVWRLWVIAERTGNGENVFGQVTQATKAGSKYDLNNQFDEIVEEYDLEESSDE